MISIHEFAERKKSKKKISMVTCYDAWSAKLISQSEVDCVLVGDSVSMVVHGYPSTVHATVEMMSAHISAVARVLKEKFIVGDMPFLSFRRGVNEALRAADVLMKAGAHAIKLEGVDGHEKIISQLIGSGVPVMGHLGLTPQSIHQLGGYKVQGKDQIEADRIFEQAKKLDELGCFSIVLECIPTILAQQITESVQAATIGIGAGDQADGQVLVLQDMLGMNLGFKPKFLRTFLNGGEQITSALNQFHQAVSDKRFPSEEESYK